MHTEIYIDFSEIESTDDFLEKLSSQDNIEKLTSPEDLSEFFSSQTVNSYEITMDNITLTQLEQFDKIFALLDDAEAQYENFSYIVRMTDYDA